jgi:hypothetical protein
MAENKKGARSALIRGVAPFAPLALALAMTPTFRQPRMPELVEREPSEEEIVAVKCDDVQDFRDCHSRFRTGCSKSAGYDPYLNFLKNNLDPPDPDSRPVRFLSKQDFEVLDTNTPQQLDRSNHLEFRDQLSSQGEGKIFGLIGYLYYAKKTGAESSNCQLDSEDEEGSNVDYHIGIGFDEDLATRLSSGGHLSAGDRKALQQTSIIVEMTPHYRATFETDKWTIDALRQVVGKQVRVVGQLIIDSEHNVPSQNCALANTTKQKESCWRASVWELHPVTQFEFCKAEPCSQNSTEWAQLGTSPLAPEVASAPRSGGTNRTHR